MTNQDEARLVKGIEKAISYTTQQGLTPNDAIYKVASEQKFNAPQVERMAQAFNKTKSVHFMKHANEQSRSDSFPLADSREIVQRLYSTQEKTASEFNLPKTDFTQIDFHNGSMDKVASLGSDEEFDKMREQAAKHAALTPASLDNMIRKKAHTLQGIVEKLDAEVVRHKYAFESALSDFVYQMSVLPESMMKKTAQKIVNGYPTTGPRALAIARSRISRDIPDMEKTANTAVMPTAEPFLSLQRVYSHAEKWMSSENRRKEFDKEANRILGTFGANTAANVMAGMGNPALMQKIIEGQGKKKVDELDTLDPVYYNKLKGIETIRSLMDLGLYDKELSQYDLKDLVQAYNSAVSLVPSAYDKPEVLRSLMMKNLQSGGQKDLFEIKQESDIEKQLSSADAKKAEAARPAPAPVLSATLPSAQQQDGLLYKGLHGATAALRSADKEKQKQTRQQGKKDKKSKGSVTEELDPARVAEAGGEEAVREAMKEWLVKQHGASGKSKAMMERVGLKDRPEGSKPSRRGHGQKPGDLMF
jgi:hypothetical protein